MPCPVVHLVCLATATAFLAAELHTILKNYFRCQDHTMWSSRRFVADVNDLFLHFGAERSALHLLYLFRSPRRIHLESPLLETKLDLELEDGRVLDARNVRPKSRH